MKSVLQSALQSVGIYYAKRQYMPSGVDWLWDIRRLLGNRPLGTVIDVGANVGNTTAAIKARFPGSSVHAIEPVAATFEILTRTCATLADVTAHRVALSDTRGRAMMATGSNSELNHLIDNEESQYERVESVETNTLEEFCETRAINRIGLLKIDAEGSDLRILQGGRRLWEQRRVAFLFSEVGFNLADKRHLHVAELLGLLPKLGFQPYAFYDYYHEGDELVFANLLSVCPPALATIR